MVMGSAKKATVSAARLVGCVGVGLAGAVLDVPAMTGIAISKLPVMLFKGWKKQIVGMENCAAEEGCPRVICLPITGAILLLWPVRVAAAIPCAVAYSFKKGVYSGVVAYKEGSIRCGLRHVVAAISEYDEKTNDMVNLGEGSCLPRPTYHRKSKESFNTNNTSTEGVTVHQIGEFNLEKLLEFMQSSAGREKGQLLLEKGLVDDNKLSVDVVALTILNFLLHSSSDGKVRELERKVSEGFVCYDPLEVLECQMQAANLEGAEQEYLADMVSYVSVEDSSMEAVRKATLQAFGRRIRGIAKFVLGNSAFRQCYREYIDSVLATSQDMISF